MCVDCTDVKPALKITSITPQNLSICQESKNPFFGLEGWRVSPYFYIYAPSMVFLWGFKAYPTEVNFYEQNFGYTIHVLDKIVMVSLD